MTLFLYIVFSYQVSQPKIGKHLFYVLKFSDYIVSFLGESGCPPPKPRFPKNDIDTNGLVS